MIRKGLHSGNAALACLVVEINTNGEDQTIIQTRWKLTTWTIASVGCHVCGGTGLSIAFHRLDTPGAYVRRGYERRRVSRPVFLSAPRLTPSRSWQWDPAQNKTTFQGDVAHTCRNFDKLRDWGKSHMITTAYDTSVRIEDDIVIPVIPKQFDL